MLPIEEIEGNEGNEGNEHFTAEPATITKDKPENYIYNPSKGDILDKQPEYQSGALEFNKLIASKFDKKLIQPGKTTVKIFVTFIVEQDGLLTNITIVRTPTEELGKEALRALKDSPKWKPGTINNKPIRVLFNFPLYITVEK